MKKHYIWIAVTLAFVLCCGVVLSITKEAVAEDEEIITEEIASNTAETSSVAELSGVYSYSEVAMVDNAITMEKSTLEAILSDTAKEGLKLNGTVGSMIMNRQYLTSLMDKAENEIAFSLAVGRNTVAVSAKSEGSTIYGDKGLCLVEVKYDGNQETYVENGGNKVGISCCYADGSALRWQMAKSESYTISSLAKTFTDTSNHWAKNSVAFLASRGVVSGTSDTTFAPDVSVTRGQFLAFLARTAYDDYTTYETDKFLDVAPKDYFYHAVAWGVEKGITYGVSETSFAPNAKVTRQEMAAMCSRYLTYLGVTVHPIRTPADFTDAAAIDDFAKEAVADGYNGGYISGKGKNLFDPKGTATRAEAVTMISCMIYYITAIPH